MSKASCRKASALTSTNRRRRSRRLMSDADIIFANGLALEEPTFELAEANKRRRRRACAARRRHRYRGRVAVRLQLPGVRGQSEPAPLAQRPARAAVRRDHPRRDGRARSRRTQADLRRELRRARRAGSNSCTKRCCTATQTVPEANRKLLTYHDSWAYWAPVYGFTVVGAVQPSDFAEPSPQDIAAIIDQVERRADPGDLRVGGVSQRRPGSQIADETGAEYIDDLRDDDLPGEPGEDRHTYIGLMVPEHGDHAPGARRQRRRDGRRPDRPRLRRREHRGISAVRRRARTYDARHAARHVHEPVGGLSPPAGGRSDVNLTIMRGDFVGFVGPSGAGKTTLLRTMLGAVDVYAGSRRHRAATGRRRARAPATFPSSRPSTGTSRPRSRKS